MRTELLHNVIVVISVNSAAVLHTLCEPCRASSLGGCSHVVAVLFSLLDYVQKHGPVLAKTCTSGECSWNKGKKRNKNPGRISEAKYSSKKKLATLPMIDFDPRPVKYREINAMLTAFWVPYKHCLKRMREFQCGKHSSSSLTRT